MFNLAISLQENARRHSHKTAFVLAETRLSFAQLNAAANQVANGLSALGIGKGDKVALSCPNLPFFPIIYYGILKAGATVTPLNVLLKRKEIAYHLDDSDSKAYFCFQGTAELPMAVEGYAGFEEVDTCEHFFLITPDPSAPSPVQGTQTLGMMMKGRAPTFETVQTMPDDTAVILYTSGTTGRPKGAELTHFNLFTNAQASERLMNQDPGDVNLVVLPLFHSFGQTVQMNTGIYIGVTSVLLPRFDPGAVLGLMEKEEVTHFAAVPTMYWALLNYSDAHKYDLKKIAANLKVCCSGGAPLPLEVLRGFEAKFNVPIIEGYGLSETSPVASFNPLDRERKPGSVGVPVWGIEMKVVDKNEKEVPVGETGEIVIRGHNIMKGYYKRPEATAQALRNDWFHSADIGKMDEDGYFYIVDRTKDMIIRGGFNVYPREVEETMLEHPAISLAAVVGVPDDQHGEEIKAFVVLKEGASASPAEIIAWCKQKIAGYKYPRAVEIRDSLPMTATGKILKTELRGLP